MTFFALINSKLTTKDEDCFDFGDNRSAPEQQKTHKKRTAEAKERKVQKLKRRRCPRFSSPSSDNAEKVVTPPVKKRKMQVQVNVAVSNFSTEVKNDSVAILKKLGASVVDHVIIADCLLTTKSLKFSPKLFAAICKGIPIVG